MTASDISVDIVQKTRSIMATALPQQTVQSLKAMSKEQPKEMKVPLAARHFLSIKQGIAPLTSNCIMWATQIPLSVNF